jgi:hypothetical protein
MLLVLQIDEAVRRVSAGKWVNGNVDALAIKIMSQSTPSHFWFFFQLPSPAWVYGFFLFVAWHT